MTTDVLQLDDLYEDWADDAIPYVDREDTDPETLTPLQRSWRENGYVILPGLVPNDLIDNYCDAWLKEHGQPITVAEESEPLGYTVDVTKARGWEHATPYMQCAPLRELVCWGGLQAPMAELTGEPMGVHLNLTGWVSTRRDYHSDQYLNDPYVGGFYVAAWIALDDIALEAGPFQWIEGSHHWPPISQAKIRAALGVDGHGPDWPKQSERILTPLFEDKLYTEGLKPQSFYARRGDVLLWSSRLLHRGSVPLDETLERRALIAHFSGIHHRPDFPAAIPCGDGWLFPIESRQPV